MFHKNQHCDADVCSQDDELNDEDEVHIDLSRINLDEWESARQRTFAKYGIYGSVVVGCNSGTIYGEGVNDATAGMDSEQKNTSFSEKLVVLSLSFRTPQFDDDHICSLFFLD